MIYNWVGDDQSGHPSTLYHCVIWHSFAYYAGPRTIENPDKVVSPINNHNVTAVRVILA